MAGKTKKRVKHVPQRTCVGCRRTLAKRELIRLVRSAEGVVIDPTGKIAGRGAYLHNLRSCWERGLKGTLAHALKTSLTDQDQERLRAFLVNLPEDASEAEMLPEEAPGQE
ncbi:MAG TPA: YlxR family protein [Anaerolineaceae bacterium]|nr:YlxR family protein [Anaerolineaceae bacterium]